MTKPIEFKLRNETHRTIKGDLVELKDQLYFVQTRTGFDGRATVDHIKQYPSQFQEFKNANPLWKLPPNLVDVHIGEAKVEDVPVAVESSEVSEEEVPKKRRAW